MALSVPYPSVPTNGQPVDASQLLANMQAVYQAIQSFDASQIQAATLVASAFNAAINPNTLLNDTISPFVKSGCVWTTVSGFNGTMSGGVIYAGASGSILRVSVNSVGSKTFTASQDTYVDIDYNGNITYVPVSNGAAAPALTANSVRVAKVVTSGAAITSITQSGSDSLGNIIYPNGPTSAKLIQNPYKFCAYRSGALTLTANSSTTMVFDTKSGAAANGLNAYDTSGNYSTSTGLFTAPISGYYFFSTALLLTNNTNVLRFFTVIGPQRSTDIGVGTSGIYSVQQSTPLYLTQGSTIGVVYYISAAQPVDTTGATFFTGFLISAT